MSLKFRSPLSPIIIYHDQCLDGFTAAWVVYNTFRQQGIEAILVPDSYNTGMCATSIDKWLIPIKDRDIYIVDFSYPAEILTQMCNLANDVVVIDHHESAIKKLNEAFPTLQSLPDNLTLILDQELSGAGLTWQHFNCFTPMPDIVRYVQDRDLWKFDYKDTKAYCLALAQYDKTILIWDVLNRYEEAARLIHDGYLMIRVQEAQMESIVKNYREHIIQDMLVPVFNCPGYLASEFGNMVMTRYSPPFSATYFDGVTHRHWSLRSNDASVNVAEVASSFGGGGHRNAAGFVTELNFMFPQLGDTDDQD